MTSAAWSTTDAYLADLLVPSDPELDAVLAAAEAAGLPPHNVSPLQGRFLMLLARIAGARRILEIGTLAGYSTIWLARALPDDGRVVTLEADPRHAAVARANFRRSPQAAKIVLREGAALETLPRLAEETLTPFDLVFIDADKPSNVAYLGWARRLCRPGAVIVADNVVRGGAIASPGDDPSAEGVRAYLSGLAALPSPSSALQTVGCKGWDGFAITVLDGQTGISGPRPLP